MKINNSFLNVFPSQKTKAQNNVIYKNFTNLAPLEKDTVSFSGKLKGNSQSQPKQEEGKKVTVNPTTTDDKKVQHSSRGTMHLSQRLYDESEYAAGKLKFILGQYFKGVTIVDLDTPDYERYVNSALKEDADKPIVLITTRRKHPNSIAEKMSSKKVKGINQTKEVLTDIIGARIIITGNSTNEGDLAIEKLTQAVKDERIRVNQVKNHGQNNYKLNYATRGKLNKLVDMARKHGSPTCSYTEEPRDSGYLAIHILTDAIEDGYRSEIQIMGLEVERFKALEDIFYKCYGSKAVPEEYAELAELLRPVKENPKLAADFMEYTKRAYAYERRKPINSDPKFLSIPSDLNIPPELDFNAIQKMKERLDDAARKKAESAKKQGL